MNTEITIHPKLQHYGLTTGNLDAMVDWYRKVLGMIINHRSAVPAGAPHGPPFSALAFISNDETDHRIVFFEVPGGVADPDKPRHTHLMHAITITFHNPSVRAAFPRGRPDGSPSRFTPGG